ncbi:MAG: fibronectin type III domain-containing protein [Paludibacteraceae bacterium]|nr:fibronectin type III domain-containing protein [Paludibacteraceae bacterium]
MKKRFSLIVALVVTFVMAAHVEAAYVVQFEPHENSTFSATLNGTTFYGGVVSLGDELSVTWRTNVGWLFLDNDAKVLEKTAELVASDFDSDDVLRIYEPDLYKAQPRLMVRLLSKTSAQIMWDNPGDSFSAYRLWISLTELSGNPDYWKNTIETDKQSYTVTNLIEGAVYHVYVQGGDLYGYVSDVATIEFTAQEPGDPCEYIIEMDDAYGDGWTGNGLLIKEGVSETFITLESGYKGTQTYVSQGFDVEISWVYGGTYSYPDELSFTITDASGIQVIKVDAPEAAYFTDGQVLFKGKICDVPICESTISGLDWKVNSDTTKYTITWAGTGAASYEVAMLQKTYLTQADIEAAAKPVSAATFTFDGKPHGIYDVFVRGICADGIKGLWNHIRVCDVLTTAPTDSMIKSYSKDIKLDYTETADLMATAYANGPSASDIYPFVIYHLVVADSTDVMIIFSSEQIWNFGFLLYQDTLAGAPLDLFTMLGGGETIRLKGDYYIVLQTDQEFGEYTLQIQKPQQLVPTTVTLPFEKSGKFADAVDYVLPSMPVGKCVAYKLTPTDTVDIMITSQTNNPYGGVGIMGYQREISPVTQISGNAAGYTTTLTLLKDTTYYFVIACFPNYGGIVETDTFAIKVKLAPEPVPTPVEAITLDFTREVSFTDDDYIPERDMTGKVFCYVPDKDTTISYSIELLGEDADNAMLQASLFLYIYKDSLLGSQVASEFCATYNYIEYVTLKAGVPYYFLLGSFTSRPTTAFVSLRAKADWSAAAATATPVELGQLNTTTLGCAYSPFTYKEGAYYNNYGSYAAYKVHLEKDKTYKIMSHALYEDAPAAYVNMPFEVTVLNPKVTTGSFNDRRLTYSNYVYDGWNVVNVTPAETGDYPIIIGAPVDRKWMTENFSIEFAVKEVVDIEEIVNTTPVTTAMPYEKAGEFKNNVLATTNSSMYFHRDAMSYIEEAGAYNVEACKVEVMPGDTLFYEFGGEKDAMIHIYNNAEPISAKNPIIVDEVHYDFPLEKGYVVNEDIDPVKFTVVGSFVNVDLVDGLSYTFRVSTKGADLEPVVVTAVADKSSVQVNESAGIEGAMIALADVHIKAVDGDGKTIANIDAYPHLWDIDMTTNTAKYELSNIDLPVGYTFLTPKVWVEVSITWISTSIEAVEQVAPAAPRKVLREGRILILTPNGTFDMFGRRVE